MPATRKDAQYWRNRAAEARALADGFTRRETKRILYGIAESYDQLAADAERQAGSEPKS